MPCRGASEENRHGFASRSSSAPVPGRNPLRGRGPRRRRGTSAYPFALSGVSRRPARRPAGRYGGAGAVASAAPRSTGNRSKIISTPWNGPAASALTKQRRVACPPAPNPSPIRRKTLAPSGAGVFFFVASRGCIVEIAERLELKPGSAVPSLAFPEWAGVCAGLADPSFGTNPAHLPGATGLLRLNSCHTAEPADGWRSTSAPRR
jgi:hypothetical protein